MAGDAKLNPDDTIPKRSLWSRLFERGFHLEPGDTITGRGEYRIRRVIGEGGMGRVYLAEKRGSYGFSKLMAVKVLRKDRIQFDYDAELFFEEARLTGNLVHPNIIQTYQLGERKHFFFIVMEHVFGVTLLEFIERHTELKRPVPIGYGLYIMNRILSGLHYAHNKHNRDGDHLGIVHRDICPSNIMISFRGVPKLFDFGVAKFMTSPVDEKIVNFGKYPYMAPEQVEKRGTDPRSDLYSLGLVMYELFTGRLVHEVDDTKMLLESFEKEEVPPAIDLNPELPPDLSDLIGRAIALNPNDRFRSAKVMRQALDSVMFANFLFPDPDDFADYLTGLFPDAAKHRWW